MGVHGGYLQLNGRYFGVTLRLLECTWRYLRAHGGTWDTWEYLGLHGAHRKYLGVHAVFGGTWGSWGYLGIR